MWEGWRGEGREGGRAVGVREGREGWWVEGRLSR